jgi:hypothetical protein
MTPLASSANVKLLNSSKSHNLIETFDSFVVSKTLFLIQNV